MQSHALTDTSKSINPADTFLSSYHLLPGVYDEFFAHKNSAHQNMESIVAYFNNIPPTELLLIQKKMENLFYKKGTTFNVYENNEGHEKIFPFDVIPRMIFSSEWISIERGLIQRTKALNAFLNDIYHKQLILEDKYIPAEIILTSKGYLSKLKGYQPLGNVYIHVSGIDLIRTGKTNFLVLEDNLKVPSGVSYVLENRKMMKRYFSDLFNHYAIRPIDDYPIRLKNALQSLVDADSPLSVILTPGPYNSAYFEHVYLAHHMGLPLVLNNDIVVEDDVVYLKTTKGLRQIHCMYRRIDDEFLDPLFFNSESLLGIPKLMQAYLKGNILLANAPGNGVADDKAVYPYIPAIIRYYLGEEPILPQVKTYSCMIKEDLDYIQQNMHSLVIKNVGLSGGKDILIGAQATEQQLSETREKIRKHPRDYIAQPLQELSTCPTICENNICAHRVDLRPFIITGKSTWVLPGGLTRVALQKKSYIVNSSRGGGSKDTWVLQ